jgi:hypothetical protein
VRERECGLRHPDKVHGVMRRDRERQRLGIGKPNVFARENHEPPRDEAWVFPALEHFRQPIQRGVRIAATATFDER